MNNSLLPCVTARETLAHQSPVNDTFMMVRKMSSKKEKKIGTNSQFHQQF
jgi:hypothetical protein